jgi:hypothetical protein
MKYIKLFEKENKLAKVGDYVISKFFLDNSNRQEWSIYLNNTVGQIIRIKGNVYHSSDFIVKYYLTDDIYEIMFKNQEDENFIKYEGDNMYIEVHVILPDIKEFSSDKEYLEMKIVANKYNI